jgi:integrase
MIRSSLSGRLWYPPRMPRPDEPTTALALQADSALVQLRPETQARIGEAAKAAKAANTWRAYKSGWADFERWCHANGAQALPASVEAVCGYVADRAAQGHRPATLDLRLTAISQAHVAAGYKDPPTKDWHVRAVLRGVRRGAAPPRQKRAATAAVLAQLLAKVPPGLVGLRDRALLLVGWAGALRRSELVGLAVEHLEWRPDGVVLHILESKTGPKDIGLTADGSALCPVGALRAWLAAAPVTAGLVFSMTPDRVAIILKRYAAACGLDAAEWGGHSLRAGYITEAFERDIPIDKIMSVSAHRRVDMLLRYKRSDPMKAGPGAAMALNRRKP